MVDGDSHENGYPNMSNRYPNVGDGDSHDDRYPNMGEGDSHDDGYPNRGTVILMMVIPQHGGR